MWEKGINSERAGNHQTPKDAGKYRPVSASGGGAHWCVLSKVHVGEWQPQSQFIVAEGLIVLSASSAYDLTFTAAALILKLSWDVASVCCSNWGSICRVEIWILPQICWIYFTYFEKKAQRKLLKLGGPFKNHLQWDLSISFTVGQSDSFTACYWTLLRKLVVLSKVQ